MLEILETLWGLFCNVLLPNATFWCVVAVAISISIFSIYLKTKRKLHSVEYFLNIVRDVSKILSRNHEVIAFNDKDDVIYTTHPQLYENKEEFLQNLSTRVTASQNYQNFRNFLESNMPCNTTFSGSGSGLHNQFKKWHATINILDAQNSLIGEKISVVTISDISKQFSEAEKVSLNYNKLENFIDHFPFGIFYINNVGEIIGANTTFANMVNAQKEKISGVNIGEFIENFNSNIPAQKQLNVTVKPRFTRSFSAIMVKSQISADNSIPAWILYKSGDFINAAYQEGEISRNVFGYTSIPSVITTMSGKIIEFNPAFASLVQDKVTLGRNKTVQVGDNIAEIIKFEKDFLTNLRGNNEPTALPQKLEVTLVARNEMAMAYISQIGSHLLVQLINISAQKVLEQQLLQSQKMQAVGQLVGGIAHDFNNLLTAMIGFCDLLLQRYTSADPSYGDVLQIKQNASRAAILVKQLLAFSKQQTSVPKIVSITDILVEISSLLRRLIGIDIELQIIHGREIWQVRIDENQFEQVIINLVVNARDAIKENGQIKITTRNFYAEKEFVCINGIAPVGDYVEIEVSDNGCGISPEDINNIFDPFFSKKDEKIRKKVGTGTGLGLATVYGIINQNGSFINVQSVINEGTSFTIYIPRYDGQEQNEISHGNEEIQNLSGTETILLVEDEEPVRLFSARALREKGYKILEASSGEEALQIAEKEKFDLLVTDVVMPKMDGPTLSKLLKEKMPSLKTIFISGYTEETFRQDASQNADIHFLQKPFTLRDLAVKVKRVLKNAQ